MTIQLYSDARIHTQYKLVRIQSHDFPDTFYNKIIGGLLEGKEYDSGLLLKNIGGSGPF